MLRAMLHCIVFRIRRVAEEDVERTTVRWDGAVGTGHGDALKRVSALALDQAPAPFL